MNIPILKKRDRKQHTKLEYHGQIYHAFFENNNIFIYASRFINLVQILDLSSQDFADIGHSSLNPALFILTKTHLMIYSPFYSKYGSINFRMIGEELLDNHYEHMTVSKKGDYVVMTKEGKISVYQVRWGYTGIEECQRVDDLSRIAFLKFNEEISEQELSYDDRYLATLGSNKKNIYIWDFDTILEAGAEEGTNDALKNFCLKNKNQITQFFFRWSDDITKSLTKTPNILLGVDDSYYIKIWVENTVKDNFTFFLAYRVKMEDIHNRRLPIETIWINYLRKGYKLSRPSEFLCGDSNIGAYSLNTGIPIILGILVPYNRFEIHRLYNVFNVERQILGDDPIILEHQVFKSMRDIIMVRMTDTTIAQILGLDSGGNLMKIQLNMKNPEQIILFSNVGEEYNLSKKYFINEDDKRYSYFNKDREFFVESISPSSVPYKFQKHKESHIMKIQDFDELEDDIHLFFTNRELVFFILKDLKKALIYNTKIGNKMFVADMNLASKINYQDDGMSELPSIKVLEQKYFASSSDRSYTRLLMTMDSDNYIVELSYSPTQILELMEEVMRETSEITRLKSMFLISMVYNFSMDDLDLSKRVVIVKKQSGGDDDRFIVGYKTSKKQIKANVIDVKNKKLINVLKETLSDEIKNFSIYNKYPYYVMVVDLQNTIYFYKLDGTLLVKYDLQQFLESRVRNKIFHEKLNVGVYKMKSNYFLVLVENFVLVAKLLFDIDLQKYRINMILRYENSNELYYGNFKEYKYNINDDIRLLDGGVLFAKTENSFRILDDNFDSETFKLLNKTPMLNNLNFKILENIQFKNEYEPENLLRILSIGGFGCVAKILTKIVKSIQGEGLEEDVIKKRKRGDFFGGFDSDDDDLLVDASRRKKEEKTQEDDDEGATDEATLESPDQDQTIESRIQSFKVDYDEYKKWIRENFENKFNIDKLLEGRINRLQQALEMAREKKLKLKGSQGFIVEEVIKIMIDQFNNKRGQDPFSCFFALSIRLLELSQKNVMGMAPKRALKSNEVIWAFHSNQEEVLFDLCFPKGTITRGGSLNWKNMSTLCVPMWYNNSKKLKTRIEQMNAFQYAETRNPEDVVLWYVAFDKLPLLITLYNSQSPPNTKMVKFLKRNFKIDKNKKAASKNAFVLLSQQRYLMSAAFFMLGGNLKQAVDVLVNYMGDLQLGIALCKVKENIFSNKIDDKPVLKELIEKNIIKKGKEINDLWLVSIGYTMLGKHVKSLNCIFEILENEKHINDKQLTKVWPSGYYPLNSSFHPSVLILIKLLKDSIKVKRELQGGATQRQEQNSIFAAFMPTAGPSMTSSSSQEKAEKLKLNMKFLYEKCYEYFFYIGSPILGLTLCRDDNEEDDDHRHDKLKTVLTRTYLRQLTMHYIATEDWKKYFVAFHKEIEHLTEDFELIKKDEAYELIENLLKNLKSPKILVSWYLSLDEGPKALHSAGFLSMEMQHMSLYIVKSNNFELKPKAVWNTTLSFVEELSETLTLLEGKMEIFSIRRKRSRAYSLKKSNEDGDSYLKDMPRLDNRNFREKVIVVIIQICYTLFLVSVNLGAWENSSNIIKQVRDYLTRIKSSTKYVRWIDVKKEMIEDHIKDLRAILEDLPDFGFVSPSHYNESNHLRKAIEGVKTTNMDWENLPGLQNISTLLFKVLYKWIFTKEFKNIFETFFELDDIVEISSYKIQSIASLRAYVMEQTKYLRHDFFLTLLQLPLEDQIKVAEESKKILSPKKKEFLLELRQLEFFSMEEIGGDNLRTDFSRLINTALFSKKIEEVVYYNLFAFHNHTNNKKLEEFKKNLFQPGIEVVKYKQERQSGINRMMLGQGIFKSLCILKDNFNVELVILAQKSLMKYNLFDSLFNKMRQRNGTKLVYSETLGNRFSGNYEQGRVEHLDEQNLSNRPLSLRVIYNLLFSDKLRKDMLGVKNMNWNQLSFILFEEKNMISTNIHEIQSCATHPNFPLIFAGQKSCVSIIYSKTMTAIAELKAGRHTIHKVIINNLGDRIIGIDSIGDVFIWRYNLLTLRSNPSGILSRIEAVDLCFLSNSSSIAVLTKEGISCYDMLKLTGYVDHKTRRMDTFSGGTLIRYLPYSKNCLVICGKKSRVYLYNMTRKVRADRLDCGDAEILTCETNPMGTIFALGFSDGIVRVYDAKMRLMSEFDPFRRDGDKKSNRSVVMMTVVNSFLIAGSAGGIISIITRM